MGKSLSNIDMDRAMEIEFSDLIRQSIESSAVSTFSHNELLTMVEMIQYGDTHKSLASKLLIASVTSDSKSAMTINQFVSKVSMKPMGEVAYECYK